MLSSLGFRLRCGFRDGINSHNPHPDDSKYETVSADNTDIEYVFQNVSSPFGAISVNSLCCRSAGHGSIRSCLSEKS